MSYELQRAAYSVLLPAFAGRELDETVRRHLNRGGVSILLGDTPDAYLARHISFERRRSETQAHFMNMAEQAALCADAPVLVAVDQELGGIQRLHRLVPGMPTASTLNDLTSAQIEAHSYEMASSARVMGVNLFLAPILDGVTGVHPWLPDRNRGADPAEVSRIACAFIRGVQRAGVIATARLFPGHDQSGHDPAVACAPVPGSAHALEDGLALIRQAMAAGVQAIMPGSAVFPACTPCQSARASQQIIGLLRDHLAFDGLFVSDDLDAVSILRDGSIADAAVAALCAGAHLLLVSSEAGLDAIAQAIVAAVQGGRLAPQRLLSASAKVRATAQASRAQVESGLYVSFPFAGGHMTRRVMR